MEVRTALRVNFKNGPSQTDKSDRPLSQSGHISGENGVGMRGSGTSNDWNEASIYRL